MFTLLAALLMVSVIGFFYFDGGDYLSFASVQSLQGVLLDQVAADPMLAALGFAAIYVMITALSLPGATILTLLAGALFGLIEGLLLASFASTFERSQKASLSHGIRRAQRLPGSVVGKATAAVSSAQRRRVDYG